MCHETWSLPQLKTRLAHASAERSLLKEKVESSFLHAYYLGPKLESSNELVNKLVSLIKIRCEISIMLETYGIPYYDEVY